MFLESASQQQINNNNVQALPSPYILVTSDYNSEDMSTTHARFVHRAFNCKPPRNDGVVETLFDPGCEGGGEPAC
ncbi:unnamed protein product [Clavelina lepadiformis]|uniref:Uncharacterized protein n=1 Tax=Clavelina lepadiformis TaxID=159417 RepID=A0ABP0F9G9_CLALP